MTEPTYRVVAGMRFPEWLFTEMTEAFRAEYATLTEPIEDDEAAGRAVLKHLVTQILINYRTKQVADAALQQIAVTEAAAATAVEEAKTQALAAAGLITEAPTP